MSVPEVIVIHHNSLDSFTFVHETLGICIENEGGSFGSSMSQLCIEDPLGAVTVCAALAAEIEQMGFAVGIGSDSAKLNSTKLEAAANPFPHFLIPKSAILRRSAFSG